MNIKKRCMKVFATFVYNMKSRFMKMFLTFMYNKKGKEPLGRKHFIPMIISLLLLYFNLLMYKNLKYESLLEKKSFTIIMIGIFMSLLLTAIDVSLSTNQNYNIKRRITKLINGLLLSLILAIRLASAIINEFEGDVYFAVLIQLNYMTASYLLHRGFFRTEFLILHTGTTLVCCSITYLCKIISEGDSKALKPDEILKICSSFCLMAIYLFSFSKENAQSSRVCKRVIEKLFKNSPSGILLLEDEEVLLYNKIIGKILDKDNKEIISFSDLTELRFTRYIKVFKDCPTAIWRGSDKKESIVKNSKIGTAKHYGLKDLIEILKRSPDTELTFYMRVEVRKDSSFVNLDQGNLKSNFVFDKAQIINTQNLMTEPAVEEKSLNSREGGDEILGGDVEPIIESRQFEVKVKYIDWKKNTENLIFMIFHDVTEAQHIKESEKENEFMLNILDSFSHELKTPLNITKNLLSCALAEPIVPQIVKEKLLSVSKISLGLLNSMISDIVDFLKIETGQLKLDFEVFPVKSILEKAARRVEARMREKQITLLFELDSLVGVKAYFDKRRLKRVVTNLLLMHGRHTSSSSLTLGSRIIEGGKCQITIKESGESINIKESYIKKSNDSMSYSILNGRKEFSFIIAKLLAREMKNYGLERFYTERRNGLEHSGMIIPLIRDEKSSSGFTASDKRLFMTHESKLASAKPPKTSKYKENNIGKRSLKIDSEKQVCPQILIVDDDPFNLLSLEMILEKIQYKTLKASNGAEAIRVLHDFFENHPCKNPGCQGIKCIFMDLMMPVMDGKECSRSLLKIMESGQLPLIPIIACTANDSVIHMKECEQIGMKGYMAKPLHLKKIKENLAKVGLV